jgi:PKD repeat protein
VAAFTSNCTDLTCDFTDTSSDTGGSIVSWTWDFDDGTTSQEQSPSHTFTGAGGYNVKLTVKDDHDVTSSVTQLSTVSAPAGSTKIGVVPSGASGQAVARVVQ